MREAGDNMHPLHWAAAHGHVAVVRSLLDAGGDPHGIGDVHELDAIGRAGEHREVADLLAEHGARHHVEFVEDIYDPPYGGKQFSIRLLDGYQLIFLQPSDV